MFHIGMRKLVIIIILTAAIISGYYMYQKLAYLNILVKFDELEPFEKQMNVYYKGFKIGKTTKIYPDKDYKNTYLRLKIHPHNIKLPENITAKIQKKQKGGYVNIIYPDSPSLTNIKNNVVIPGKISKDISALLESEGIEEIVNNVSGLLDNANNAVVSLNGVFTEVHGILVEIRPDIKKSVSNLAKTTSHLEKVSADLSSSLDKKTVDNSINNIEETTLNIKEITSNINGITEQVENSTMPVINGVLCETHSTVNNVKEITGGVKHTLQKHFGLGRLMFGRPISKECNY